jgi:hypothetical protein
LEKEILTVWKREILTVWKGKYGKMQGPHQHPIFLIGLAKSHLSFFFPFPDFPSERYTNIIFIESNEKKEKKDSFFSISVM